MTGSLRGCLAALICCVGASTGAAAAVSLPYENARTNAVDWTTLPG